MALSCQQATEKLQQIRQLNRHFTEELAHVFEKSDMSALEKYYYDLRGEITLLSQELEKNSPTITVKDAKNPFHEQFKAGSIPDTENPEKKEITYDLLKTLEEDILSYRSHGLEHWAKALEEYKDKIDDLTPEQKKTFEYEIKNGAIPLWMPGKEILLSTTTKQIQESAKPIYIENGEQLLAQEANFMWSFFSGLIDQKNPLLVQNVPNHPYLSLQRPTPQINQRICNKTLKQQQDELITMNQERTNNDLCAAHAINLYEYIALQIRCNEHAITVSQAGTTTLNKLEPLDSISTTYFIDLPFFEGSVPSADYGYPNRAVYFNGSTGNIPKSKDGFRLAVRVEV